MMVIEKPLRDIAYDEKDNLIFTCQGNSLVSYQLNLNEADQSNFIKFIKIPNQFINAEIN